MNCSCFTLALIMQNLADLLTFNRVAGLVINIFEFMEINFKIQGEVISVNIFYPKI